MMADSAGSSPGIDHEAMPYVDAVRSYAGRDMVRLDVPGHGGDPHAYPELAELFGEQILRLDLPPLVDGIDQGPVPTPMQQAARLVADAWGAHRSWLLTNGASKGNLVTCLALRYLGQDVVAQRSMHSSVMDGMALAGLRGHFVQPEIDQSLGAAHGLTADALGAALDDHPEAVAAYVVTPSYFGAVADVAALAGVAHSRGVVLVVDEAWGSHFGFHPDLPRRALSQGADIVINSTHKLGGSLTQSALLHIGRGPLASELEPLVNRAFRSMQSTSASSLLMMSLDVARHSLIVHGHERIGRSLAAATQLREGVRAAGRFTELSQRFLTSPDVISVDPLRIVIDTRSGGISGHRARQILFHDHHIHVEMSTDATIVAVIGPGSVPDVQRVLTALHELPVEDEGSADPITLPPPGAVAMSLRDAYFAKAELVAAEAAVGRVSTDSLAAYPPGIPNLLPGEVVTAEVLNFLRRTAASPFGHVRGAADPKMTRIRVVRE